MIATKPNPQKQEIAVHTMKILRALAFALLSATGAFFLVTVLFQGLAERTLTRSLRALPNHDFTAEVFALYDQGRISEALDWARYVTNNPALPGQIAASNLVVRLEREQNSLWLQADRAAKGFITGSGNSIEEMSGAIASDMVVYGDCRDLIIQGYYRVTGHETDPVVIALASVGLLTEWIDAVDWVPAALKAFKKTGALSQRLGDWILTTCKRSAQLRRIDPALKQLATDLRRLYGRLGLAKTATVFRHADTAADVSFLAKQVDAHPNEIYRFLATAEAEGTPLLRRYADTPRGLDLLVLATRKGRPGIELLRRGGELRSVTLSVRYGERILRMLHLNLPQQLLYALTMRSAAARTGLWAAAIALSVFALWEFRVLAGLCCPRSRP